jgi:Ca2+-binding EF-hand superfamily protein
VYKISKEQLADYKELFILFDKDMNGVLSFAELGTAMKTLGQRLPGKYHM